jgi:hypothetical protein
MAERARRSVPKAWNGGQGRKEKCSPWYYFCLVQLAVTFPRPAAAALGPGKLRRNAGPTRLQRNTSWRDANNGLNHARLVRSLVLLATTIYGQSVVSGSSGAPLATSCPAWRLPIVPVISKAPRPPPGHGDIHFAVGIANYPWQDLWQISRLGFSECATCAVTAKTSSQCLFNRARPASCPNRHGLSRGDKPPFPFPLPFLCLLLLPLPAVFSLPPYYTLPPPSPKTTLPPPKSVLALAARLSCFSLF